MEKIAELEARIKALEDLIASLKTKVTELAEFAATVKKVLA